MTTRLVLVAAMPAAAQRAGRPPAADAPAVLMDASLARRQLVGVTHAWHAPEQAAIDTARQLGLAGDEDAALAAWWDDGTEPLDTLLARTGTWLDRLGPSAGRVAAVASPPVVRALVVRALGVHADVFWRLDIAVASVTVLTHAGTNWRVRSISDR